MILVLALLAGAFMFWRLRRRARADRLSGTTYAAPVFYATPPARVLHNRKDSLP